MMPLVGEGHEGAGHEGVDNGSEEDQRCHQVERLLLDAVDDDLKDALQVRLVVAIQTAWEGGIHCGRLGSM